MNKLYKIESIYYNNNKKKLPKKLYWQKLELQKFLCKKCKTMKKFKLFYIKYLEKIKWGEITKNK